MLANVLLIVLVIGIVIVLVLNVALMRIIVRAVRNREAYEAANTVAAADASELSTLMVHLKKEHIDLTKYIHQAVHNLRDSLNALSLRSHANHLDLMKELSGLVKTVNEVRSHEMAHEAQRVDIPPGG